MKKIISVLLAVLLTATMFAACGGDTQTDSGKNDGATSAASKENLKDDNEIVELTLPAYFMEDSDYTLSQEDKDNGFTSIVKNEDGSATYTISKAKYDKHMENSYKEFVDQFNASISNGDFESIKKVECSDNLDTITAYVDKAAYENSLDSFAVFSFGVSGMMYTSLDVTNKDKKCTVIIKDETTGETISETTYPDVLEEAE